MKQTVQSEAFEKALLRSERHRIVGMLVVLGAVTVLAVGRVLLWPRRGDGRWIAEPLGAIAALVALEIVMLMLALRAERRNRMVPHWVWVLNSVLECSGPTLVLLGLTRNELLMGPYKALLSPPVLIYFFFIILATLRLNPWLCVLAGVVSAAQYLGLVIYTEWAYGAHADRDWMARATYYIVPIMICLGGLIAAGVAKQIRGHVIAALAEAETRRKLERIEEDLRIARTIQRGLLPKRPPSVKGYEIAGWIQPADQTGGDYYDWMELPDGRVLLTIADATGHGIGPALLVAACRAYFRAVAMHDDPLEKIVAQVDALLAEDVTDGRFITAAVALLEPRGNRMSLYSAGHGPQFLYVAERDAVTQFGADQPPLGIRVGDWDGVARVLELEVGDAVVLVTDGVFECANGAGELMGTGRLGEVIRRHRGMGAAELIGRVREEVAAFSGGTAQRDDMTVVVVRRGEG